MKMKKFFGILLVVTISLFMIACDRDNTKEYNKANTEESDKDNIKEDDKANIKEDDKANTEENDKASTKETSGTDNKNELFIVAGGHNKVPGICEYYLHEINVTPRIKPSIITKNSSYYDVKNSGNIYIDIILDVYSLSNEAKMTDDIITSKIKINNNEYSCFSLLESPDGSNLEKYGSIKPLETRNIHYIAEVPKADSTGELEIILTINGKDFSNKFQLDNPNTQPDITQGLTEEEYYIIIKEAKQRQQDYIDSIDDPKVKQSVQTPYAAAIAESTALYIKYPQDIETIDSALKRVLNGE
jgi:hypothetical protein